MRMLTVLSAVCTLLVTEAWTVTPAHALSDLFTYQGQLQQSGSPVNGTCDLQFRLFSALSDGTQIGGTQNAGAVNVSDGLFTVQLNFGSAFNGDDRWLEIAVRCPSGSGAFSTLTPRQQLTASPYALYAPVAASASNLSCNGCVSSSDLATAAVTNEKVAFGISYTKLSDTPLSLPPSGSAGGSLSGSYPNPGLSAGAVGPAQIQDSAVQGSKIGNFQVNTNHLAQSAVTSEKIAPGTIQLNDLAFSPGTVTSINTGIGLTGGTITSSGTVAANIGTSPGTVAAGDHNHGADYWQVGGNIGAPGAIQLGTADNRPLEVVVNSARVLRIDPNATSPNLLGGVPANHYDGGLSGITIAGGGTAISSHYARGDYATIGGGRGNEAQDTATVSGGQENTASNFAATIGGGLGNQASQTFTSVAGGTNNTASGPSATIGGGDDNSATHMAATVGGGSGNEATRDYATVSGGQSNIAAAKFAAIGGGGRTDPNNSATANRVTDDWGTVAGGGDNQAGDNAGTTEDAVGATVGGGGTNRATGPHSTVGGGFLNTASGAQATVGGGTINVAGGMWSTIPGGILNSAGGLASFAAGGNARADHNGAFVWSDGTREFHSTGANQFTALATGGFRFYIDTGSAHCDLTSTGGWQCFGPSDRNIKTNFASVDGRDVLVRLAAVPIETWIYKTDKDAVRHIGPMAQDFHAAFDVGGDERQINTIDADGVALAAIQGLYQLVQEKNEAIASLQKQNSRLEERLVALERVVLKGSSLGPGQLEHTAQDDRRSADEG